jgi:class 3 adenylate cyclase
VEPEIRYLSARDGTTIAYYSAGEGLPIVLVDVPYSHLIAERNRETIYPTIAAQARLIRYDPRGFGLSERNVRDFSLPTMVNDLADVVDKLELRRFVLIASRGPTSPVAIQYAAQNPDRVLRLVLYAGVAHSMPGFVQQMDSVLAVPGADWTFVSETLSRLAHGWDDQEASISLASLLRDAIDLEHFRAWFEHYRNWDASAFVSQVTTPTLVLAINGHPWFGQQHVGPLMAALPDARLAVVSAGHRDGRDRSSIAMVRAFLGVPAAAGDDTSSALRSGAYEASTAIILFLDIVDSTALTERMGNAAFRDRSRALDAALRAAITRHHGTPIEGRLLGDGVLATFAGAADAIVAALDCSAAGADSGLPLHAGIHAGDVIREEHNVFGGAVNIAARISACSAANEVLVSDVVRGLARAAADVSFEDRGEQALKGIDEPVRVYAVHARERTN